MYAETRRFFGRIKRRLFPIKPFSPKALDMFPPSGKKRVLLIATNNVDSDTRVKKTARSLREIGYSVGILGVGHAEEYTYDDPAILRIRFNNYTYRQYFRRDLRKIAKWQTRKIKEQQRLKKIVAASRDAAEIVRFHDKYLESLPWRTSLWSKIILICQQRWKLSKQLDAIDAAPVARKRYAAFDASRREKLAKITDRMKQRRIYIYSVCIKPIASHLDFYRTFRDSIHQFQPDIIHANDLLTLPAAVKYAKNRNVKVLYDAHELEMHRNKSYSLVRNLADQFVEWRYIKRADDVITVSEGIADVLASAYGIRRPTVVLNSPSRHRVDRSIETIRSSLGLTSTDKLIVYTGIVTMGRGIELLVASLVHLPRNYHVMILGRRRADKDLELVTLAEKLDIRNQIHLIDPVEPHNVPAVIRDADLFINPAENVSLSYDLALPNKLFDAVFAQVPILVGDLTEMKRFVSETGTGICRDIGDQAKMSSAITEAIGMRENGAFDNVQWDAVAEKYCWSAQEEKLAQVYRRLEQDA